MCVVKVGGESADTLHMLAVLKLALFLMARPPDLAGWGNTTWGMTAVESLGALKGDGNWCPHANTRVCVASMKIGSYTYRAELIPDSEGKLKGVAIHPSADQAGQAPFESFVQLSTLLTEKYGAPDHKTEAEKEEIITAILLWTFPSTSIELRRMSHRRYPLNAVTLRYFRPDKAGADRL